MLKTKQDGKNISFLLTHSAVQMFFYAAAANDLKTLRQKEKKAQCELFLLFATSITV